MKASESVEAYISSADPAAQGKLRQLRAIIKETAPSSVEAISYRMPFYAYRGRLAYFALRRGYVGLYIPPPVVEEHARELAGFVTTPSAIHLPLDRELPVPLIRKLIRAKMKSNESRTSAIPWERRTAVSPRDRSLRDNVKAP